MHIHVVGLGPVGCLLAYHLRQSLPTKHTIALVHKARKGFMDARLAGGTVTLETSGAPVTIGGFTHKLFDSQQEFTSEDALDPDDTGDLVHDNGPIDSMILCTKAHGAVSTLQRLLPRLLPTSTIVLMQNGMGIYEYIVEKVFRNPEERPHFILGSINHGVRLKSHMHVVHGGFGDIKFGVVPDGRGRNFEASIPHLKLDDITPNTPDDVESARYLSLRNTIAALSSLQSLNAVWKPIYDIRMAMRRKVVVNSVINPLTALMDCRNGLIFKNNDGRQICHSVCWEASRAFHAQWLEELNEARASGQDVGKPEFPIDLSAESLENLCLQVASNTAHNYSSMLADVRLGRRTEIHVLNGYLIGLGKRYRIPMNTTKVLFNLIRLRAAIPPSPRL